MKSLAAIALTAVLLTPNLPAFAQDSTDKAVFVQVVNKALRERNNPYLHVASDQDKVTDGLRICTLLDQGRTAEEIGRRIVNHSLQDKNRDMDFLGYASIISLYAIPGLCPRHNNKFEPLKQAMVAEMALTLCNSGRREYCQKP